MRICPKCGYANEEGSVFCQKCATHLESGDSILETLRTRRIGNSGASAHAPGTGRDVTQLPDGNKIYLEIEGTLLTVNVDENVTLGREHGDAGDVTMVDLEPFGAYVKGISRRHAQLRRSKDGQLALVDLGSSNGTYLNGQLLEPLARSLLDDGDEIVLGELHMILHFSAPAQPEGT